MADKQQQYGQQGRQGQQGQQGGQGGQEGDVPRTVSRGQGAQAQAAGTNRAPAMYPNKPCFSDLLWLCYYEIASGFSDDSRHTSGTDGATAAWKPGKPESVTLPQEYYQE